jgi:hypothetical protein
VWGVKLKCKTVGTSCPSPTVTIMEEALSTYLDRRQQLPDEPELDGMQGTFKEHSRNIQGTFREHSM